MPTYEYSCMSCGEHLEIVQSFSDEPLTTCPNCAGSLRKVFGSIGIVLKGSGFYKTDSRTGSPASTKSNGESATKESGSKESGSKESGSKESGSKESTGKESGSGSKGSGGSSGGGVSTGAGASTASKAATS